MSEREREREKGGTPNQMLPVVTKRDPQVEYLLKLHNRDEIQMRFIDPRLIEPEICHLDGDSSESKESSRENENNASGALRLCFQRQMPRYLVVKTPSAFVAKQFNDILQLDIPTMAIHEVLVNTNTSLTTTAVLCAALPLVVLRADASKFTYLHERPTTSAADSKMSDDDDVKQKTKPKKNMMTMIDAAPVHTIRNTVWLKLDVAAPAFTHIDIDRDARLNEITTGEERRRLVERFPGGMCSPEELKQVLGDLRGAVIVTELVEQRLVNVRARDIKLAGESVTADSHQGIHAVYGDHVLALLKPGGRLHMTMLAEKGTGREHAKFMPLCHVGHRQVPRVQLICHDNKTPRLTELEAEALVTSCPQQVFDIEDATGQLKVVRPFACTNCGKCTRLPTIKRPLVEIGYEPDEFLLHLDPVGQYADVAPLVDIAKGILATKRGEIERL